MVDKKGTEQHAFGQLSPIPRPQTQRDLRREREGDDNNMRPFQQESSNNTKNRVKRRERERESISSIERSGCHSTHKRSRCRRVIQRNSSATGSPGHSTESTYVRPIAVFHFKATPQGHPFVVCPQKTGQHGKKDEDLNEQTRQDSRFHAPYSRTWWGDIAVHLRGMLVLQCTANSTGNHTQPPQAIA